MRTKVLLTIAVLFLATRSFASQPVPCESLGDSYRECRVGASGTIVIVAEKSDNLCREGVTWGTASEGVVWVTRGCRALFRVRAAPGTRVVCESLRGELTYCTADTSNGVSVLRQLSKARCLEGETWGYEDERGEVWVAGGCRAEFILARPGTRPQTSDTLHKLVVCESRGRRTECAANTADGVQLVRQLGDADCRYGRQWGYDAKKIWVSGGCRAEFAVRGDAKAVAQVLECESQNLRRICEGDTRLGVALVRQVSERKCILGQTWGFDEKSVWVTDGCHAQFALGGFRLSADAVPETALRLTCESQDGALTRCAVDASRGAGLVNQLSEADCILNRTWGYDRDGIWVSDGCRADFAVAQ